SPQCVSQDHAARCECLAANGTVVPARKSPGASGAGIRPRLGNGPDQLRNLPQSLTDPVDVESLPSRCRVDAEGCGVGPIRSGEALPALAAHRLAKLPAGQWQGGRSGRTLGPLKRRRATYPATGAQSGPARYRLKSSANTGPRPATQSNHSGSLPGSGA